MKQKNNNSFRLSLLCTSFFLWFAAPDTLAQDLFELTLQELLEIKVESANKTRKAIKNIPASVTVVSRGEIQRFGYTSLEDLLQNTPGLYLTSNTESTFVGIRGNANGRMQLLVNGAPQHPSLLKAFASTDINQFNIPIDAIDQVEIIRGPMSVIYGNNAFLGVINVITNNTQKAEPSRISASVGDGDNREVFARVAKTGNYGDLIVNTGISESVAFRGNLSDMMKTDDLNNLQPGFNPRLDLEHQQKVIDLSFSYRKLSSNVRYQNKAYEFYATTPDYGGKNLLDLSTLHVSIAYESGITDRTSVRASAIYSKERYDYDDLNIVSLDLSGFQKQISQRSDFEVNLMHEQQNISLIGGYRLRFISDQSNEALAILGDSILLEAFSYIDDFTVHDLFTQADYKVNANHQLIAGFRVSKITEDVLHRRQNSTGQTLEEEPSIYSDDALTNWRIAWIQRLNSKHSLRYQIGTAAYDNDLSEADKPEKILSFEINHLATFEYWQWSTSVFQNNLSDISERTLDTVTLQDSISTNGEWSTKGVESIIEFRPQGHFRYSLSALIQSSEDTRSNETLGYSPSHLLKFKVDYQKGDFSCALNLNVVDSMKTSFLLDQEQNPIRLGSEVPAYTLASANLAYSFSTNAWASLRVNNLFDETIRYAANEVTENLDKGLTPLGRVVTLGVELTF